MALFYVGWGCNYSFVGKILLALYWCFVIWSLEDETSCDILLIPFLSIKLFWLLKKYSHLIRLTLKKTIVGILIKLKLLV